MMTHSDANQSPVSFGVTRLALVLLIRIYSCALACQAERSGFSVLSFG